MERDREPSRLNPEQHEPEGKPESEGGNASDACLIGAPEDDAYEDGVKIARELSEQFREALRAARQAASG